MPSANLGTLQQIDVRAAWSNEAYDFTPWLAQNLDALGDVLGISLELEGQEVAVESFSADILARNPLDDSLVLIENQLDTTDHSHLGQIMTYLAGLEAQTVIWIAPYFRDPHLSAVRWLNDHTSGDFAFFAVRLRVVQIGDSPLAPVFEVEVKPNAWERQLQAAAVEAKSLTGLGQRRKAFWTRLLERHPLYARDGAAGGISNRWHVVEPPGVVISYYYSVRGVGLFVRGLSGMDTSEVYQLLLHRGDALAAALGVPFGMPDDYALLIDGVEADTADASTWDELVDWLDKRINEYTTALQTEVS